MSAKYQFKEAAGYVCKLLYPIPISYYEGNGDLISICTLSSIDLLKKIARDNNIMEKVVLAGRLFSENKGIDSLVTFCCIRSLDMKYLILCGKDTKGHYPGDALMNLMNYGIDTEGRIINCIAPYPYLTINSHLVDKFRKKITMIDMRGCLDLDEIKNKIKVLI